jgi:hypothetical protein
MAEEWQHDYNHERPHESLGNVPPDEFINPTLLNTKNLKFLITSGPNIRGAYRAI